MAILKRETDWMAIIAYGLFIILVMMMIVTAMIYSDEAKEREHCKLTCIDKPEGALFINGECWCDLNQNELNETYTNDKP